MKKLSLLTVLSLAFYFTLFSPAKAQEPLKHEKGVYTDSVGRLYVNKALPLYLWLSTSPDENSKKYRLKSESAPQYSNPFYFDTEGYNSIQTPWKVDTVTKKAIRPLEKLIFEVYSDSKAPDTKVNYGETPLHVEGDKVYAGKTLQLALTSEDETSGVKQIYLSVNGASFSEYHQTKSFDKEQNYTFKYYAVDNVGNAEELEELKIIADYSPPVTSHEIEGDKHENVISPRTKIKLSAKDNLSGTNTTYYRLDDGPEKKFYNSISFRSVDEGKHTLYYYSKDNVENMEAAKSYEFFLDRSSPIVVDEVLGNQFIANGRAFSSGRTKFKLTAVDNRAGVKAIYYSISGGKYQLYDKPFYLPSKSGSSSIRYYAVDNVNNKGGSSGESSRSTATYVDLTGPTLSYSFGKPSFLTRDTVFISQKTPIKLKAVDTEAGVNRITYSIDGSSDKTYNEPIKLDKEGFHKIDFTGYDNVDNSNRKSFFCIVDETPPELYIRYSIVPLKTQKVDGVQLEVYPSHVVAFLSATDKMVGYSRIYYKINDGYEKLYASPISGFKKGNQYTIKARVLDHLGNEGEKIFKFIVDEK